MMTEIIKGILYKKLPFANLKPPVYNFAQHKIFVVETYVSFPIARVQSISFSKFKGCIFQRIATILKSTFLDL